MNSHNDDILQVNEIGTLRREKTMEKVKTVKEKPHLKRDVQRLVNWLDKNVLPLVALVLVSGLAVKGLQVFLPEMSETTQMVVSILGVSVLVVKLKAEYNK